MSSISKKIMCCFRRNFYPTSNIFSKRRLILCLLLTFGVAVIIRCLLPKKSVAVVKGYLPYIKSNEVCNEKISLSSCANKTNYGLNGTLELFAKKDVVRKAKTIASNYGMVMLTFMNKAFVPFLTNWMCHTKGLVNHSRVLVVATDESVYSGIVARYPSLTVMYLNVLNEINGKQRYCSAGFMRVGIYRSRVVNWIIQENIPVFLFELDSMWLRNPIPFVTSKREYDLTIISSYPNSFEAAIGFYFMRNTTRMKMFWIKFVHRLDTLDTMFSCLDNTALVRCIDNDQIVLMNLILEHYQNLIIYFLPLNRFLDGKWYRNPNLEELKHAFILNFNFIIGIDEKIVRARHFGHWFVTSDNVTCLKKTYTQARKNLNIEQN